MKKNAIVITNGCPENRIDCAETEQCLVRNGWEIITNMNQADLIILNLCGLLNESEAESLDLIKRAKIKKKADAKLIVTGCLPKINNHSLMDVFEGDIIKGHNIKGMLKSLDQKEIPDNISANYLIPNGLLTSSAVSKMQRKIKNGVNLYTIINRFQFSEYRKYWKKYDIVQPNTYYIKVSSGCVHACSYCAVRKSRGVVKSKPIKAIKSEFLKGLEEGYSHFAFIGTDLGSYGKDINTNLPRLLQKIISIEGNFKIRLRNVHPQLLIRHLPEMTKIVKSGKISHITTAIQHGNDRILRLMNRSYKIKDCMLAINTLNKNTPNLTIRAQLIVGFPGETQIEFDDTLRLIGNIKADFFEIYPYSPRINTLAAKMTHQNPIKTIHKRHFTAIKKSIKYIREKNSNEETKKMGFFDNSNIQMSTG